MMSEQIQAGQPGTLLDSLERIPNFINNGQVEHMIKTQEATLERLECTNKSIANCSKMAQDKLTTTSKLYKRTSKQLAESKKDLDVIYKKILDMKAKLKTERPDLFQDKDSTKEKTDEEPNEGATHGRDLNDKDDEAQAMTES